MSILRITKFLKLKGEAMTPHSFWEPQDEVGETAFLPLFSE